MIKGIRYITAIALSLFAAGAQAQAICSGAGIHQSCFNQSNNSYSNASHGTQLNGNNGKNRWIKNSQTVHGVTYSKGALYGTQLNGSQPVSAAQIAQRGKQTSQTTTQTYQNIKNSRPSFTCDQSGCHP